VNITKCFIATIVVCLLSSTGFAKDVFVAGVTPGKRPENAPVISGVIKPDGWYGHALTGISQPYPNSLHFLENQGNWFTPFIHPGMPGPYDIRRWHKSEKKN